MASLTNCEFMVKGYHYTEPTTPIRTDSCRLYLDTKADSYETQTISSESMRTETLPYNTNFTYTLKNQPKIGTTIDFAYDTSSGPGDFNVIAGTAISQNDIYNATYYEYDGNLTITITSIDSNIRPYNFEVYQYTANIAIEESNTDYTWVVPTTAYLNSFIQDSAVLNSLTGDIGGRQASVSPDIPNLQDDDILSFTNLPTGTATNGPITVKEIKENYTSGTNPFDNSLAAYFYCSNNTIMYVLQRHSSADPEIINPTIVRNADRPYLLHLKGIHGFYIQT